MIHIFNCTASTLSFFVNEGQVQAPGPMVPQNGCAPPGVFILGLNRNWARFDNFRPPLPGTAAVVPGSVLTRTSAEATSAYDRSGPGIPEEPRNTMQEGEK